MYANIFFVLLFLFDKIKKIKKKKLDDFIIFHQKNKKWKRNNFFEKFQPNFLLKKPLWWFSNRSNSK